MHVSGKSIQTVVQTGGDPEASETAASDLPRTAPSLTTARPDKSPRVSAAQLLRGRTGAGSPVRSLTDVRGNTVRTTQLESDWSVDVLRRLNKDQAEKVLEHAAGLCRRVMSGERSPFYSRKSQIKTAESLLAGIEAALSEMRREDGPLDPGIGVIRNIVSTPKFKMIVDSLDTHFAIEHEERYEEVRGVREFTNRGRIDIGNSDDPRDRSLLRRNSAHDEFAGITASEYRNEDAMKVFDNRVLHGKGVFRADPDSEVVRDFRAQDAPFIAGASGSISAIALSLSTAAEPESNAASEALLGCHIAAMVVGGHHSLTEGLIAAQAVGFFKDIPRPLEDYKGAMSAFEKRMKELHVFEGDTPLVETAPDNLTVTARGQPSVSGEPAAHAQT